MPGEMIPIVLFVIMGVVGLPVGLAFSPVGQAFARRLSGGRDASLEAEVESLRAEIEALRGELDDQRGQVAGQIEDVNTRLDFAERVMAQRPKDALPGGR